MSSFVKAALMAPGSERVSTPEQLRENWSSKIAPILVSTFHRIFCPMTGFATLPERLVVLGLSRRATESFHPDMGVFRQEVPVIIEAQWAQPVAAPQNAFLSFFVSPTMVQTFRFSFTFVFTRGSPLSDTHATQAELVQNHHFAAWPGEVPEADYVLPPFGVTEPLSEFVLGQ
jgi:hypothetical protein